MKKKHHKKGRRNNGSGGGGGGSHPRPRPSSFRLPRRGRPPDWKTIGTAIAGGAGSATLGALIVNQKILSPEAVGLGLMLGGSATAYFADGITRVAGAGVASVGAGQLALALLARQAVKSVANQNAAQAARPQATNQSEQSAPPPPPPPPPVEPAPRRSATGGGVVVDLFRDTATDLDMIDDEFRFGMHDEPRDAAEPLVIDLDEAA